MEESPYYIQTRTMPSQDVPGKEVRSNLTATQTFSSMANSQVPGPPPGFLNTFANRLNRVKDKWK